MDMKLLLFVALVFQNLAIFAVSDTSFQDGKSYYSRDPHTPSTPKVSVSPPYGSGSGYGTPRHSSGTKPPTTCGTPPKKSSPTHRGGGYYHSPPTSTPSSPPLATLPPTVPSPAVTPTTPPLDPNSPPFSLIPPGGAAPTIPIVNPTPPFGFTPSSPFPFNFWRNNPTLVWGLVGMFGTLGNSFGLPSFPGFGAHANVMQALSNTRTDGYGALYREGTAALLNAMAHRRFPYTTSQVRDSFVAALSSNQAAGAQARIFQMANEGRIKT